MKLICPAPGQKITSPYGPRIHPISKQVGKMHRGIDYGGQFNVIAAGDGIVTKVSFNGNKRTGGGHVVIIKHASNLFTVYYHGREATKLKVGDRVTAGQFVYVAGSTGASTGNHLHFEVRTGSSGQWGTDVDPNLHFAGNGGKVKDIVKAVSATEPAKLRVDGRLGRGTWKALQAALKPYGYSGIPDGLPGKLTYMALQKAVGVKADGIIGPNTRKAVQEHLKKKGFYKSAIDGVWGRGTISALQLCLNANKF
jgi:murein DD-endopeptidase MepM/ murein hydrolase activator NlpD